MYNHHPRKTVTCVMESDSEKEEEKESKDDKVESEQEDAKDLDCSIRDVNRIT